MRSVTGVGWVANPSGAGLLLDEEPVPGFDLGAAAWAQIGALGRIAETHGKPRVR
jgi:hypothetical protein